MSEDGVEVRVISIVGWTVATLAVAGWVYFVIEAFRMRDELDKFDGGPIAALVELAGPFALASAFTALFVIVVGLDKLRSE